MKNKVKLVNRWLDQLGFDWSQYTLERLTNHLAMIRGREITYIPTNMPLVIDGVWLTSIYEDQEFVFFDRNTVLYLQEKIKLHELAHMIANDETAYIDPVKIPLLQERLMTFPVNAVMRSRQKRGDKQEKLMDMVSLMISHRFNQVQDLKQRTALSTKNLPNLLEVMA